MGLISSLINYASTQSTNAQNERLMRESWSREDNAVQRRKADLEAAGMNPVLAAGDAAAAGAPIQHQAPQVDSDFLSAGSVINMIQGISAVRNSIQDYEAQAQAMRQSAEDHAVGLVEAAQRYRANNLAYDMNNWLHTDFNPEKLNFLKKQSAESGARGSLYSEQASRAAKDNKFRELYKDSFGVYPPDYIPTEALLPLMLQQALKNGQINLLNGEKKQSKREAGEPAPKFLSSGHLLYDLLDYALRTFTYTLGLDEHKESSHGREF